jgi:predicted AAA+ superfamily ATPase
MAYSKLKRELFFWRTRSGVEVDFVVYGPEGLWAIEVKNTRKIRPDDLRGLRSFREEYPRGKTFLLYRGKDRFVTDGILCAPCKDFLMGLRPDRTLDEILT